MRGLLLLLTLAAACGGRTRPDNRGPAVGGDVILSDELRQVQVSDLWTALQHLRPNWFRRSPSVVRGRGDLLVVVDRGRRRLLLGGQRGRGNEVLRLVAVILVCLLAKCHGVTGSCVCLYDARLPSSGSFRSGRLQETGQGFPSFPKRL